MTIIKQYHASHEMYFLLSGEAEVEMDVGDELLPTEEAGDDEDEELDDDDLDYEPNTLSSGTSRYQENPFAGGGGGRGRALGSAAVRVR